MTALFNDIPSRANSFSDLLALLATSTSGRALVEAPTGVESAYRIRLSSGALVTGEIGSVLLTLIREAIVRGDQYINKGPEKIAIELLREGRLLLSLPRELSREGEKETPSEEPAEVEESRTIAIIDDDPAYLAVLSRMVGRLNISAVKIARAEVAFATLPRLETPLSALILDLHLPEKDGGLEVLRFIRSQPIGQTLPVIVLTSDESEDSRREAIALGASFVLSKRMDVTTLSNLIARITRQQRHEDPS